MDAWIGRRNEIRSLNGLLARLRLETKLIRLERHVLLHKGWENQPRAPAGQPDGGRWVGGSDGQWALAGNETAPTPESTTLEDGTRVLSIRVRAGRRSFDAQDAVVAPDGESRVFETSGTTQTIWDGTSGEVLSRSTFTATDLVPEAVVQPALLPSVPLAMGTALAALRAARTFELGLSLFTVLSARKDGFGTVLGLTAHEYGEIDPQINGMAPWVGKLDRSTLDATCPRNGEVLAITNDVAQRVRSSGNYKDRIDFGNKVHIQIKNIVDSRNDPNFIAEFLLNRNGGAAYANRPGNVRLDLMENIDATKTVCIYDYKTGDKDLSLTHAQILATSAMKNFPGLRRVIVIQVKPEL